MGKSIIGGKAWPNWRSIVAISPWCWNACVCVRSTATYRFTLDVVDETYAKLDIAQTVVMPLGPGVKAFIATGDGTASLVRC